MSAAATTERSCALCGRAFAGKAGRLLAGRPVCPACAPSLREPVPCGSCGRPTRRPGRAPGHEGLVCQPCRQRGTHATCRVCSRHRPVADVDDDGRPVCAACAGAAPATHPCPDCGTATAGNGAAPCRACDLGRRTARRAAFNAELLDQPWLRALFEAFCGWQGLPRGASRMPRRIDAYGRCFAAIGQGCGRPAEVEQRRLLAVLGAEGLRRNHLVVRFLVERLSLTWDPAASENAIEERRIAAALAGWADRSWSPDLCAYRDHLAGGDAVRPKTLRVYLTAAAGLMEAAGVDRAGALEQDHVARHLRRRPGHTASLARFVSWVAQAGGQALAVTPRRPRDARAKERGVLDDARRVLRRLDAVEDPREGRALLVAAISMLHHVPRSRLLELTRDDVALSDEAVVLWRGTETVRLGGTLTAGFRRFAAADGRLAFPGRNAVQPMSADTVAYHVRRARMPAA